MMQYIDKDALVAEIKMLKENANKRGAIGKVSTIVLCNELLSFIDTLEVKEVDLEDEIKEVQHNYKVDNNQHTSICGADIEWIAEHFFELGLKAQKGE